MGISTHESDSKNLLRQRAEEALQGQPVNLDGLRKEDIQWVLHELQVHQEELRLQNEELRRVQLELENSRDQYSDLYHFAPIGYCTLNSKGRILEANQTLADLLGVAIDQIVGRFLSQFVDRSDQDAFYLHRQHTLTKQARQVSTIHLLPSAGQPIAVRLESVTAHGHADQMRVALTDITQELNMERAARKNLAQVEVDHRLLDQREQERQQIARDLHDGVVQELTGITFTLRGILMGYREPELAEQLEAIQTSLQEQIAELRAYAGELRPPTLSKFGFEHTIRSHAEVFQAKYPNLEIKLDLHQTGELLSENTGLALFRIYQQALMNIIKHAHASKALVEFKKSDTQALLTIEDNGQGFTLPSDWLELTKDGHLGLLGMQERAEAVGGNLEIQSQPGQGTQVRVTVPLDSAVHTSPSE